MAEKAQKTQADEALRAALERAYRARALLFRAELEKRGLHALACEVRDLDATSLNWDDPALGISQSARDRVSQARVPLHWLFCHPDLLARHARALEYYRLLAAVSAKGLAQVVRGEAGIEKDRARARALNSHISAIVEDSAAFSLDAMRDLMVAEVGAELQGTWVNLVGKRASQHVMTMLERAAVERGIFARAQRARAQQGGRSVSVRTLYLRKGWRIVFGSEPDVGIWDPHGVLQCAIEIKGSTDVAGAQTRYGEAKKSFAKALRSNPRCETIYLVSCLTPSVEGQIRDDGQVRKTYNLIDLAVNDAARQKFLDEIFHYIIRVEQAAGL